MRTFLRVTAAAVIISGSVGCSGDEPLLSAATPTFSPAPGSYTAPQAVTLACVTPGATIHYTLDGATPTPSSSVYATPIPLSTSATLKAMAVATGYRDSPVASGTYTIAPATAAAPTFSPPGGTYAGIQFVTLSSTTPGARIYYTHDGSPPTTSSWRYEAPVELAYDLVLRAVAVADGVAPSPVAVATYEFQRTDQTATPTFSPVPGEYPSPQVVTLSCATPNAMILYTTDGTLPDIYSHIYAGPFTISTTTTVRASAWVHTGNDLSDLAVGTYTIAPVPKPATPTFSPPPGTYGAPQWVTLSCATPGANIFYWFVEDEPCWAEKYTALFQVSRTVTIKAYVIGARWEDPWSDTATARYVIEAGGQ